MTGNPAAQHRVELDNPQSRTDTPQLPTLGRRLDAAVDQALDIADRADREHPGAVARFALFSGGNGSSVMLDLTRHRCDAVVHINTGIGIAQTRDFVRTRVAQLALELIELHPPGVTYRELALAHGFPGPRRTPLHVPAPQGAGHPQARPRHVGPGPQRTGALDGFVRFGPRSRPLVFEALLAMDAAMRDGWSVGAYDHLVTAERVTGA